MIPAEMSRRIEELGARVRVIPVLVVDEVATARPLAEALVSGGLSVLEVTLRTHAALDAIRTMAEVPGARIGAGTLLTPADVQAARAAGAVFGVAPGSTPGLIAAAVAEGLPLLAGVQTATECMALLETGFTVAKFFPAEAAGGVQMLRALAGPLPRMRFCPTGGIGMKNAAQYLAMPNVFAVGGSWVAPPERIAARDWTAIESLAREASLMAPPD